MIFPLEFSIVGAFFGADTTRDPSSIICQSALLNLSDDVAHTTFSGRRFHALTVLGKKLYLYWPVRALIL